MNQKEYNQIIEIFDYHINYHKKSLKYVKTHKVRKITQVVSY